MGSCADLKVRKKRADTGPRCPEGVLGGFPCARAQGWTGRPIPGLGHMGLGLRMCAGLGGTVTAGGLVLRTCAGPDPSGEVTVVSPQELLPGGCDPWVVVGARVGSPMGPNGWMKTPPSSTQSLDLGVGGTPFRGTHDRGGVYALEGQCCVKWGAVEAF